MVDSWVLVVGQVARDLVLAVDRVPDPGSSTDVRIRRELLGGKGANQAVGMVQLGASAQLLGVVGEDHVGGELLRSLGEDGVRSEWVRRRGTSALLVDVVDEEGERRLLEHVPDDALLTADDVRAGRAAFLGADTVCLQQQQPAAALAAAARMAQDAGAQVVLDGQPPEGVREELLEAAWVLRADAHEAALMTGVAPDDPAAAVAVARQLVTHHAIEVVALGVGGGDVVAWRHGHRFFPHGGDRRDATGGGDSFLAGLVVMLRSGGSPEKAGQLAAACSASAVARLGGRPDLAALRR